MLDKEIEIINKLGLHARAAAKLVSCANSFSSDVFLNRNGQRVNGKSIMGVMMLAANQGSTLHLEIEGSDEQEAMQALISLINERFGEDQ
ncbi:MAG: HPr family phosphocarrier protein [Candidatus Thiodiazotropha endolucinida]|uniref:HPr-like protein Crh n=2 Tax=Candidatus Thiodiazotropha TaxID=1913444 RepID=A0A7Z0VMC2_9GAMM|nr:HPr family phosphocarrier protein [Candidatus Thiodiazotropha endolucinida]MBT3013129.1 HPr family phosphocarrier protein [Candidatus Thiodiazotropha sp. (ex Lucina pensylvanica)]MBT3017123.1 HPr family phosphocarrier protein [Candidatus Thiodiazotropha taylori]MBT3040677.1 HPr family phosphocarrier protein [Candidatus Thiodiazotropha sp. (ex Codakia orbicularis)]MBV2104588.1 HPr family phosphocarrier protein [Candidatus Thiodiazotropha sp. (ex Lucina aurantia)]MCU7942606.1 HPr family phosp